jgi:TonB family protein
MRTLRTCAVIVGAVAAFTVTADEASSRARVSLSELNSLGTVIRAYMIDHDKAPATASVESMIPLLTPTYIIHLPLRDGWDTPLRYVRTGSQSFYVISAGADKKFDEKSWATKTDLRDLDADAVYSVETVEKPGTFTRRWVDGAGKPLGVTTEEYMEANRAELQAAVARMSLEPAKQPENESETIEERAARLPFAEGEALLNAAIKKTPEKVSLYRTRGAIRKKAGRHLASFDDFEKIGTLTPDDAELFAAVIGGAAADAVKEPSLSADQKRDVIRRGLKALDRAEALKADEVQVMWYRSQLLGERAKLESDPAKQKTMSEEAEKLGERALALLEKRKLAARKEQSAAYRLTPGGDVKAPVVLTRVEPVIPELARKARISGIVIVEALVEKSGRVAAVQVLKPLPFGLDQAAVDAVKQWTFRPGTLNGQPVDVFFNLTVNIKAPPVASP